MPDRCKTCGEVHERCAAHNKRTGRPCGRWPTHGATVCRSHGAGAPQVRAAAARRLAADEARRVLGVPLEVDPADAMLEQVHEAAGNVAVLRALVQTLDATSDASGSATRGEGDENGSAAPVVAELGGRIAERTGSTSKLFDAAPHVWVTMYDAERERLVRWSKWCREAGVDERKVAVAEAQAEMLARAMVAAGAGLLAMVLAVKSLTDELRGELEGAWRSHAPGIMRQALIDVSSSERGA